MKEEYYVSFSFLCCLLYCGQLVSWLTIWALKRLAAKDLDDWEQKRVKRLPGEHDGII